MYWIRFEEARSSKCLSAFGTDSNLGGNSGAEVAYRNLKAGSSPPSRPAQGNLSGHKGGNLKWPSGPSALVGQRLADQPLQGCVPGALNLALVQVDDEFGGNDRVCRCAMRPSAGA